MGSLEGSTVGGVVGHRDRMTHIHSVIFIVIKCYYYLLFAFQVLQPLGSVLQYGFVCGPSQSNLPDLSMITQRH